MSLNQNFTVKNGLNSLGNILSGGTNLTNIFLLSGSAAVNVANSITFNSGGSGNSSPLTFDGSSAKTVSYNTIGASPLAGSSSLTTVGTIGSGAWNGSTIGIGYGGTGQTTQQEAINALAGAVTNTYYLRGNGTNVTMSAIQANDVPTLNQNTTGSAASLTTSHTLWGQTFNGTQNVTGDLSSVGNITGSADITISTASNGNITLSPNGTGIVTTAASFQAASGNFTGNLNVGQNLNVAGSLYFAGSAIQLVQGELVINAPIVYLGEDNPTDSLDIGLVGHYTSGTYAHTGLLRSKDLVNGIKPWYLFSSMVTEPSANTVSTNTKTIDTLVANLSGSVTGNADTATKLKTGRNITSSGDITFTSTSFDGSVDITIPTAIGTNKVQYNQFQKVAANSVLGNPTGSTANVSEIGVSTTGFAVLTATSAANGANALNLGTSNSVTFKDVTVSNGTQTKNSNIFYSTNASSPSNTSGAIPTFDKTTYSTAKYTFRINRTTSGTAAAAGEILVNNNNGTWEGTVYGIVDSGNIFSNVDVTTSSSTIDLTFTYVGSATYTVTIIGDAF